MNFHKLLAIIDLDDCSSSLLMLQMPRRLLQLAQC